MDRRAFIAASAGLASQLRADFTIPAVEWGKPRAVVFGSESCRPCRVLKSAVDGGRWRQLRWAFRLEGTPEYTADLARWNKRARFTVSTFPTIYFPDAGPLGCIVEGYNPATIDAVVSGSWKPATTAQAAQDGYYPTDNRRWQLYPVETRTTLISHLLRSSSHRSANFSLAWLNTLSLAELDALHSDHHDRRVRWKYVKTTISRAKARSRRG